MKHLMIFLIFFLSSAILSAQTTDTLWYEDWEGNWVADWHVSAGTWEVGTPTSGPGSAYNGQNCAATVLAGNYPPNANTRLIRHTSFVVPSANQNPRLRFWHWYNVEGHDAGTVQIKVSGEDWVTISDTYNQYGGGWTYTSIDLSTYSGSSVQIAFLFTSDGLYGQSSGWFIDDVHLETGPITFNNPEDWEAGLGNWYADRGTWQVGVPINGPGSTHSGTQCAATVLDANYPSNAYTRLISPSISVSDTTGNPSIGFWHWYSIEGHDKGYLAIVDTSGIWQNILGPFSNSSGVWTYTYFDLSSYANQVIKIAFLFTSDGLYGVSSGWFIDDIRIEGLVTGIDENPNVLPIEYVLSQNYPNPFNPTTTISYQLPKTDRVELTIYNSLGQQVRTIINEHQPTGVYTVEWDGRNEYGEAVASGVYLYRLSAGNEFVETRKMLLLR